MKKTYIPYVVFVIFIVTLFIFNIYRNNIKHESSTLNDYNYNENKTENPNTTEDFENFYYMVKEKNNEIFLFDNNMNILKKLNINFVGLREYDKKIFEQGISFDNIGDVYSLMEDFSN